MDEILLTPEEKKEKLRTYPEMFSRILVGGINVDELLNCNALIVGAGGLGSLVGEMLARTGLGELLIIDRDNVEEGNFNRLGFNRSDIGKSKAKILGKRLKKLRNSEKIDKRFHLTANGYKADIIGWEQLPRMVEESDLVFSCLDNAMARRELNYHIMKKRTPMIDGATSHLGFGGTIITVVPHPEHPCYECLAGEGMGVKIGNMERIGHCDASLANIMTMVASIQVDQGLKLLLNYGNISPLIKIRFKEKTSLNEVEVKRRKNCPIHQKVFGKAGKDE